MQVYDCASEQLTVVKEIPWSFDFDDSLVEADFFIDSKLVSLSYISETLISYDTENGKWFEKM